MTWKEFKDEVLSQLPKDAKRLGSETFLQKLIRQACLDIQTFIEGYRVGHETTYTPADFKDWGSSSMGMLPTEAAVKFFDILRTDEDCVCVRYPCTDVPWEDHMMMVSGKICFGDNNGRVSIDPYGKSFVIAPKIQAAEVVEEKTYAYKVILRWDGVKLAFSDGDCVPFTEPMAFAVRHFVKAHFALEIENDSKMHDSHMKNWARERRKLYLNMKERKALP